MVGFSSVRDEFWDTLSRALDGVYSWATTRSYFITNVGDEQEAEIRKLVTGSRGCLLHVAFSL